MTKRLSAFTIFILIGACGGSSDSLVADAVQDQETASAADLAELPAGVDLRETVPDTGKEELPVEVAPDSGETKGPVCGDGLCDWAETCVTCEPDCGPCPVCGNNQCEKSENPDNCAVDCGPCGDGVCKLTETNPDDACPADCGFACGDGVCNTGESALTEGDQHYCPVDCGVCYDGICSYQELADPGFAECKDGDCGLNCGNGVCDIFESLFDCPVDCPDCGDGICGKSGDGEENCPIDCWTPCGDGLCQGGETQEGCPADCGPCGDGVCSLAEAQLGGCVADCPETCGDGECAAYETAFACPPDCACKPQCAPDWECGQDDNGCGQPCGACPEGLACDEHTCCIPHCKDKQCGPDGCGSQCGACQGELAQCVAGTCQCEPDCQGKQCGADGCGGDCGLCIDDLFCTGSKCEDGTCHFTVAPGHCLLPDAGGTVECAEEGTENPQNPCQQCRWDVDPEGWSPVDNGLPCDGSDVCFQGNCCPANHNCQGKQCGSDGCGSTCGLCGQGEKCSNGFCIPEDCQPQCQAKECGDDGCGGQCGVCNDGLFCTLDSCQDGTCLHDQEGPLPSFCVVETVDSHGDPVQACAADGAEDPLNPCQVCLVTVDHTGWSHLMDGVPCGPDAVCQAGVCQEDVCDPIANCGASECGDNGCGGVCGVCPADNICCAGLCAPEECSIANQWGECKGVSVCEPGGQLACYGAAPEPEVCDGKDNNCDGLVDVGALGCNTYYLDKDGDDFGIAGDTQCLCNTAGLYTASEAGDCDDSDWDVFPGAAEECNGKDDNCTGTVDETWPDLGHACDGNDADSCAGGLWQCTPDQSGSECVGDLPAAACAGKECGDDGCGGTCGTCTGPDTCIAGLCQCISDCDGKECGDDGCGSTCGTCAMMEGCLVGKCHHTCTDPQDLFYDGCHNGFVSEYQANETTAGKQSDPAVEAFLDGTFVIAWQHLTTPPSGWDIAYRLFGTDGLPASNEVVLEVPLIADNRPAVVTNNDGSFVLLWESHSGIAGKNGIWARHIEADGTPSVDKDALVLEAEDTGNGFVSGARLLGGGLVFSASYVPSGGGPQDLLVRAVDSELNPLYPEVTVSQAFDLPAMPSGTGAFPDRKSITLFTYFNDGPASADGDGKAVFGRGLHPLGEAEGLQDFQVNDVTESNQDYPTLAVIGEDRYVAVWSDDRPATKGTYGRFFTWPDTAEGPSFMLHQHPDVGGSDPAAASLPDGRFVAAWQSAGGADTMEVWSRSFDTAGLPTKQEQLAHIHGTGRQDRVDVAMFGNGGYVVAYTSAPENWEDPATAQDGDESGIFFTRYTPGGSWCPAGPCNTGPAPGCGAACDDLVTCTDDVCDPWSGQCHYQPHPGNCDDGDLCTIDSCDPVADCQYDNKTCNDGDWCTEDSCNPLDGECLYVPKDCDDGNDCTTDSCDMLGICQNDPVLDGTPCGPPGGTCQGSVCQECDDTDGIPWDGCTGGKLTEFQVNGYTDSPQWGPKVAVFSDDSYAIAWWGTGPVDQSGVYVTRYSADGEVVSQDEHVSEFVDALEQGYPAIAVLQDDSHVIAWSGHGAQDPVGVYARRYAPDGTPYGSQFLVNASNTNGFQGRPDIAVLGDGRFFIVWFGLDDAASFDVFGQLYESNGTPSGGEIRINGQRVAEQRYPAVTAVDGTRLAVVWQDEDGQDDVMGKLLIPESALGFSGRPLHLPNAAVQESASVAGLGDAGFVAAWTSFGQDGDSEGVYMGRYTRDGFTIQTDVPVNTHTQWYQTEPQVAAYPDGGVVVVWSGVGDGDDAVTQGGIWLRQFAPDGAAAQDPEQVNVYVTSVQAVPHVGTIGNRGHVVVWQSGLQDGSSHGIFARRYSRDGETLNVGLSLPVPPTVCAGDCSDGNPCTQDYCGADDLCKNTPVPNGTDCGAGGNCLDGICEDETEACDDGNADALDGCWNNELVEFRVNQSIPETHFLQPAVAGITMGRNAVAYVEVPEGGGGDYGMWLRPYDGIGQPLPPVSLADPANNSGARRDPAIDAYAGGPMPYYLVAWTDSAGPQFDDIFVRKVLTGGIPGPLWIGNPNFLAGSVALSDIKIAANGAYLVAYNSTGAQIIPYAQRFTANDIPWFAHFQLDPMTQSNTAQRASAALLQAGGSVTVWYGSVFDAQQQGIAARYWDNADQPKADPFVVNDYQLHNQRNPSVAAFPDNRVVVAWMSDSQDGSDYGVYARLIASDGQFVGGDIQVNDHTLGAQEMPRVASLSNGGFVVVWQGAGPTDSEAALFMQLFDGDGNAVGDNIQVNKLATARVDGCAVDALGAGAFMVAWAALNADGYSDIWAQRFDLSGQRIGPW